MKKIYYYILFILFGIILFIYYNNSETLSIGGSNFSRTHRRISFYRRNYSTYSIYELEYDRDEITAPFIGQYELTTSYTLTFIGVFKIQPEGLSITGWDTRYIFLLLRRSDFYIRYCRKEDLNDWNTLSQDAEHRFTTIGEKKLASNDRKNIIFQSGRANDETFKPNQYITLDLDNSDPSNLINGSNKLELFTSDETGYSVHSAYLMLDYLSNLCINSKDCNNRARMITGSRDTQCICNCDQHIYTGDNCSIIKSCNREDCNNRGDPRDGAFRDEDCGPCTCDEPEIYTGNNCEKELCNRDDCNDRGDPIEGATRDEDCGPCTCDEPVVIDTCSCLNEYGVPYGHDDHDDSDNEEVCLYTYGQGEEGIRDHHTLSRRKDQYGNYCKFGGTIKYGGNECEDLLCTDDEINCNNNGTVRGILKDNDLCVCDCNVGYDGVNCENRIDEDDMTNFVLIPDVSSKWGSGNESEANYYWQLEIEAMIKQNSHYRNLIDTTNTDWFNANLVISRQLDFRTNDSLPQKKREYMKAFHGLLYLLNNALPSCSDNTVVIYTSVTTNAIMFIILAYYKYQRPELLRKIKSIVILGGATIEFGSVEFYTANEYDDTNYEYFFGVAYGSRFYNEGEYDYSFLENIPVLCLNTQHGYGHLRVDPSEQYQFQDYSVFKRNLESRQELGNHTLLLPTTQLTGDASVRTSEYCSDYSRLGICNCNYCRCSDHIPDNFVPVIQIDLNELWRNVFNWSLQDNLFDREKIYLQILEKRSEMFRKINKPEYSPSSIEHSQCAANLKYILKPLDSLTVNLNQRMITDQTGYFVHALPKNTDDTIDSANLNILSVYQKINDILVLIATTIDRNKANLHILKDFLSNLKTLFQRIPDILKELNDTHVICKRDSRYTSESCESCDEDSMMRKLNDYIVDIFNYILHCEEAQNQVDNSLGISMEDRAMGQHGPLENFPGLIFSLAESAVDTMFNSLFFEFDEVTNKSRLLTLEESGEKMNMFCSVLIGALLDGACFEGRLDAIVNTVFINNVKFEVDIDQTIEQNVYSLINTLENYLCLNSTNSKYNTLRDGGYLQQWTVSNYPEEARPKAIHWILDRFDNNLEEIIRILRDNNVFGKRCSDGELTEEAFRDIVQQAVNSFIIDDQAFPWGRCKVDDAVVPCFDVADRPLDDGTTYRENITETCRRRSEPVSVTEPEKCNIILAEGVVQEHDNPTICILEEGLCDIDPQVKLNTQCEGLGGTWTDGSCTVEPGTGGANSGICDYQRRQVNERPSQIKNEVWVNDNKYG